jgi:hypothetical protein
MTKKEPKSGKDFLRLARSSDEVKEIGGLQFIEATATLTYSEGKSISVKAQAGISLNRKGMDIAQSFGASSSYARKYALNGLFAIDDTKDSDSHDNRNTNNNLTIINQLLKQTNTDMLNFLKYFSVNNLSELSVEMQNKAIQMLQAKINKKG